MNEEIEYLRSIIKKYLSPFEAEGEIDVGPGFSYWYCSICKEMAYWDKDKINHKTDCYWNKEKNNGKTS
jgi:hypothetical protein